MVIIEKGVFQVIGSPNFIKKKFGIGYVLTVYAPERLRSQHRAVLGKHLKEVEEEEMDAHITKYILRLKDEDKFHDIIKEMEDIDGIEVALELSSLEEAFLAILRDPSIQSGRVSVDLSNTFVRAAEVGTTRPFRAMLLKNLLVIKANPVRSVILYFLNIMFVLIGIAISNFMEQVARKSPEAIDDTHLSNSTASMKKMMLLQGYYLSVGIYVAVAVYEKEKKIIDVLKVRGLQWWWYWAANFVVDYSIFFVNLLVLRLLLGDIL